MCGRHRSLLPGAFENEGDKRQQGEDNDYYPTILAMILGADALSLNYLFLFLECVQIS